jgi:hypothetical protein
MPRHAGSTPRPPVPLSGPIELTIAPGSVRPDPSRLRSLARLALRLSREEATQQAQADRTGDDGDKADATE